MSKSIFRAGSSWPCLLGIIGVMALSLQVISCVGVSLPERFSNDETPGDFAQVTDIAEDMTVPPDLLYRDQPCHELLEARKRLIKCWDFRKLTDLSDFSQSMLWQLDIVNKKLACSATLQSGRCSLQAMSRVDLKGFSTFDVVISHRIAIPWENAPQSVAGVYVGNTPVISHSNAGTPNYIREQVRLGSVMPKDISFRLDLEPPNAGKSTWEIEYIAFVVP